MGRWRAAAGLFFNRIAKTSKPISTVYPSRLYKPILHEQLLNSHSSCMFHLRLFSGISSQISIYSNGFDYEQPDYSQNYGFEDVKEEEGIETIPVKAYFLSTSIDLKGMQAENLSNVLPATSRSANYIALKYCNFSSDITAVDMKEKVSSCSYMVVFQYGSAVLFNIEDHEVESYLEIVRRHASGFLLEMRKDDYALKEKPLLVGDMLGGPDYLVLKALDTDSIRVVGSVLGQSIALDYFVSQVDSMVEEFAGINRAMEKSGTFTMDRTKLLQLVGKANSNLADVILKVGIFERSEIAWRDAKYAQIYEYLREEYEVTQRFGNLDFKLKFIEHNIHFLQEVIQNRRSDLSEWCIIFLLSVENALSIYEIVRESSGASL